MLLFCCLPQLTTKDKAQKCASDLKGVCVGARSPTTCDPGSFTNWLCPCQLEREKDGER